MSALKDLRKPLAMAKLPCALLFCAIFQGCGLQKTMVFRSPSGNAAVEVWQTRLMNSREARVELVTAQRASTLYFLRAEAYIHFVHVYWSPDENKVGVLATGIGAFRMAADVRTGRRIDFAEIQRDLSESIRRTYSVPPGEDPIEWAIEGRGNSEFFRLHPEIRLTYR